MKTLALYLLAIFLHFSVLAQGTIQFRNIQVSGPNAPVYESDGVTKVSGPQFVAELLVGLEANNLASVATTGFLTGAEAGYFQGPYQTIPGIAAGANAFVQVEVWNTTSGTSFAQAEASGLPNSWWASSVFTVALGGHLGGGVPSVPAELVGLGNSPVYLNSVPEPSTLTLICCGLVAVLFRKHLT